MVEDQAILPVRSRLQVVWDGFVGLIAALVGLAPHVPHHTGLLAGTALAAGATGTLLFGTWRAPFIALIIFAVMFSVSAFVIGPAIRGDDTKNTPTPTDNEYNGHHEESESQ